MRTSHQYVYKNSPVVGMTSSSRRQESFFMQVKAWSDGAEGWITVKGSQGTLFLQSKAVMFAKDKAKAQQGKDGLNLKKD